MSKKREHQKPQQPTRSAFTLIEILVVVSILVIMTALLVPRLRTVTKERNIREAARVVGSMFSQASQRAVTDGVSGVVLQRNDNFNAGGYLYAATRIGILRKVPNFTGDQEGSVATPVTAGVISIPYPLEQESLEIVQAGDSIRLGTSSVSYQITKVNEDKTATPPVLNLVLSGAAGANYLPDPGVFTGTRSYSIERLPRLLKSSVVDLPDGHVIDLRFSGCQTLDSGYPLSSVVPRGGTPLQFPINVVDPDPKKIELDAGVATLVSYGISSPTRASDLVILFDDQGKFDQMIMKQQYTTPTTPPIIATSAYLRTPQSPFFAFVASSELDATVNPLADENSLWVSVSNNSGVVNVGYNNPSGKFGFVPQDFTLANMQGLFQSTLLSDRVQFNNIVSAARAISSTGSAAQ